MFSSGCGVAGEGEGGEGCYRGWGWEQSTLSKDVKVAGRTEGGGGGNVL